MRRDGAYDVLRAAAALLRPPPDGGDGRGGWLPGGDGPGRPAAVDRRGNPAAPTGEAAAAFTEAGALARACAVEALKEGGRPPAAARFDHAMPYVERAPARGRDGAGRARHWRDAAARLEDAALQARWDGRRGLAPAERPEHALRGLTDPGGGKLERGTGTRGALSDVGEGCDIDASASIGRNTLLGEGVKVGPGAVIGDNVRIEDRASIGADCRVGPGAWIGTGVRMEPRSVLRGGVAAEHAVIPAGCSVQGEPRIERHAGLRPDAVVDAWDPRLSASTRWTEDFADIGRGAAMRLLAMTGGGRGWGDPGPDASAADAEILRGALVADAVHAEILAAGEPLRHRLDLARSSAVDLTNSIVAETDGLGGGRMPAAPDAAGHLDGGVHAPALDASTTPAAVAEALLRGAGDTAEEAAETAAAAGLLSVEAPGGAAARAAGGAGPGRAGPHTTAARRRRLDPGRVRAFALDDLRSDFQTVVAEIADQVMMAHGGDWPGEAAEDDAAARTDRIAAAIEAVLRGARADASAEERDAWPGMGPALLDKAVEERAHQIGPGAEEAEAVKMRELRLECRRIFGKGPGPAPRGPAGTAVEVDHRLLPPDLVRAAQPGGPGAGEPAVEDWIADNLDAKAAAAGALEDGDDGWGEPGGDAGA